MGRLFDSPEPLRRNERFTYGFEPPTHGWGERLPNVLRISEP